MPEVIINNESIAVIGPPDTVELVLDIGPKGDRGSQIFIGSGNPNSVSIGATPEFNDLYINASPGADYGYLYQYVSQPGNPTWVEKLKVSPTIYTLIHNTVYTNGEAQILIPVSNITTLTGLDGSNFAVRYSIEYETNPLASSFSIESAFSSTPDLVINFKAKEFDGTSWTNLNTTVKTHLFISLVQ